MTAEPIAYERVRVERPEAGVALVTLDRPERMNALDWRMGPELRHAIYSLDAEDEVRAIVVTGAGRAFCAGADLAGGEGAFAAERLAERQAVIDRLRIDDRRNYWDLNTPIIAAINGAAVGAGLTLPVQWDLRLVAEDAKLGFVFNRRGVIPELNAPLLVPRLVGLTRGMELLLTGRIFSGADAAAWGLCSEALPAAGVLPRALEIARDIAANVAPVSAALTKRLVWEGVHADLAAMQRRNHHLFGWTAGQGDAREGPVAFIEKRAPRWALRKNGGFPAEFDAEA
ncbi:MAG: enoyl-CoA hydratase/isomerase family protein [Alphaproteobacteria bacterium]|nr:enoyl-CoA hydratase/isomerase family protein [Alphaproteobacteria bacterium]